MGRMPPKASAGGESRAPLGIAVVGGMFVSTLLTIFVVPVVYLFFARTIEARFAEAPVGEDEGASWEGA